MARKFGRKNEIKLDPLKYNLCLIGEGGIGKTTLIKQYCERLAGEDGYMFLDVGKEDGSDAINGIVAEPVWDWEKFDDVITDIVENRYTDYKDLKVVVVDTFDELMNLAEGEVLRIWNRDNPDKKTKFFKATFQGFNGPTDKAIEIVFDRLWELKRVGVSFITIGHTKKSDIADPVSGETYSILTTNMDKRYFNAMKNKVHFLGVCYIDRDIVKYKTGRKNIVTNKEEVKGKITGEKRVVCFRDDNFSVDSKSRFADIVDRVPLDVDEFIKAITDAIKKEHDKGSTSYEDDLKKQAAEAKAEEKVHQARIDKFKADRQDEADEGNRETYIATIAAKFSSASDDVKAQAKSMLNESGYAKFSDPNVPIATIKKIASLFA
jgi:hypothetical protein